jgi:hypothetical protein
MARKGGGGVDRTASTRDNGGRAQGGKAGDQRENECEFTKESDATNHQISGAVHMKDAS